MPAKSKTYYWVSSLEKGLKLLEFLSLEGKASLSEVADGLKLDRSSCHRSLLTMRDLGFVRQVPGGGFELGGKLFEMALRQDREFELRKIIRPFMEQLRDKYQETVNLGLWQGDSVVYLEKCESAEILRADLAEGTRIPLYCTGLGKALLAHRPEEELNALIQGLKLKPHTNTTIVTKKALKAELAEVRKTGLALDREELHPGLNCVAVPLKQNGGPPRLALSVAGPAARFTAQKMEAVGRDLKHAAREITSRMGGC